MIAQSRPEDEAIRVAPGNSTTYFELLQMVGSVAESLITSGATIGSRIALLQEPSALWVASILAVLRIGAIYIPLDLATPWARLAAMVKDCQPAFMLVDDNTNDDFERLQIMRIISINVSCLPLRVPEIILPIAATAANSAVILYTSGSSGAPKGIIVHHEAIRNHIELAQETYQLGPKEVILQQSPSTFDLSYTQLFTALCHGGCVYVLPRSLRRDAREITALISSEGITYTYATPTEYSSWLDYGRVTLLKDSNWRSALCTGEPITGRLLSQFRRMSKRDLRLFNNYGPTETCVVAASSEVNYQETNRASLDTWPCRNEVSASNRYRPLSNYSIYVLDNYFNMVGSGIQGEIYIGGAGVSRGYVDQVALTAHHFLPNRFCTTQFLAQGWTRMHRTGDLGRWTEDGALVVEGRIAGDTQVKVRGNRVDLRDVEAALFAAASNILTEAVVSLRQMVPEDPAFLVAHCALRDNSHSDKGFDEKSKSLSWLGKLPELPNYMRPAMIIPLLPEDVPRTVSGKLDRKAIAALPLLGRANDDVSRLCEAGHGARVADQQRAEFTTTEFRLLDIWKSALSSRGVTNSWENATADTEFFEAGGTSLVLLAVQAEISKEFGTLIPLINLFGSSTLRGMACLVEEKTSPAYDVLDWNEESTPLPTTVEHLRFRTPLALPKRLGVVVLTGSTGYLGHALLCALIKETTIREVHCIGVRDTGKFFRQLADTFQGMDMRAKVHVYPGDLKLPCIGLSVEQSTKIFTQADCIIHNGAEVSHMQSYRSLRLPNVTATKVLVEMSASLGRRIPIHYISTIQIGIFLTPNQDIKTMPEMTMSECLPPLDGVEGYPTTKWVSERFLERLADVTKDDGQWPVCIHRPGVIEREANNGGEDLLHNIRHFAMNMEPPAIIIPEYDHLRGYIYTVALKDVVAGIVEMLSKTEQMTESIVYRHYTSGEILDLENPIAMVLGSRQLVLDRGEEAKLIKLSPHDWAQRAREMGLSESIVQWVQGLKAGREVVFPQVLST